MPVRACSTERCSSRGPGSRVADRLVISAETARRLASRVDARWRPAEIAPDRFRAIMAGRVRELTVAEVRILASSFPEARRALGI